MLVQECMATGTWPETWSCNDLLAVNYLSFMTCVQCGSKAPPVNGLSAPPSSGIIEIHGP
jgi:hypothetical protein